MVAEQQKKSEIARQQLLPAAATVGSNALLVPQNSLIMAKLSLLHSQLSYHLELPLKAATERKRLSVISAIKTAEEVKKKYEGMVKDKDCTYAKCTMKRAFIERFYQIEDLDLSDGNQHRFITENWKGILYHSGGTKKENRIYICDAEVSMHTPETAENLKSLHSLKS